MTEQEMVVRITELEAEVERLQEALIEANNPGIDIEAVRAARKAGIPWRVKQDA